MIENITEFLLQLNFIDNERAVRIFAEYGIAVIIFLFFLVVRNIIVKYVLNVLLRIFKESKNAFIRCLIISFEKPLKILLIVLGAYLALLYLPLSPDQDQLLSKIFRSLLIFLFASGLNNFVNHSEEIYEDLKVRMDLQAERIVIPFISRVAKGIIIAMAFLVFAQEWGYDINGFIAGLGLGGLAFALAAQDTIANFFGGFVIITDKPFTVGDWIRTPSVEGTIEDINFRSTKVRTFEKGMVTVPNKNLANEPITNFTKRDARRITFNLGVTYSTPREKLEKCVNDIRSMLEEHSGVCKESVIFVRFDSFGDSSLDIFIYFFTNTIVWGDFLEIKEDINFKIMQILENEDVEVAFPSRSLYFESTLESTGKSEDDNNSQQINSVE